MLADGRELILIDQRGVGRSEPALDCPGFVELYLDLLDQRLEGERLDGDAMRALKLQALSACAETLGTTADLAMYNSAASAADIDDLRIALGYEQLDLWGTSYGTWLALAVMRDYPAGVRSAVLDAPAPPQVDLYTDTPDSFATCAGDDACDAAYPDLEAVFLEAIERLEAEPIAVTLLDPIAGERVPLLMDGDAFLEQVFRGLYSTAMRQALPQIIHDAREGTFDALLLISQQDVLRQYFRSWGMYFSVLCHDEVPFSSLEAFAAAVDEYPELGGMYSDFEIGPLPFELCPRWGAGAAPSVESERVVSDIPVLVTTGQYDPIVPPDWGQSAIESLPAATFHLFPGLAHGASGDPCATEMMLAFLDEPTAEVDAACLGSMLIAPFDLPSTGDVEITLEPFRSETLGLAGMRPTGWTEAAAGQYVRGSSGTDPTSLLVVQLPLPPAEALALLTERFGLAQAPEPLATEGGELEWTRYRTEAQGVAIDFAIAPLQDSAAIAVLTSSRAERDRLVDAVLLPVLASVRSPDMD